jgi:hypothetical protein
MVAGGVARLRAELAPVPHVLSAESMLPLDPSVALRSRFGLRPPPSLREMSGSDVALSDPVFLRLPAREAPAPADPDGVYALMAGSLSFQRDEALALYWESYGFLPNDTVQITLTIRRDDARNTLRRAGAALGVVSPLRDSISIRWTEPDPRHARVIVQASRPVVGRVLSLDFRELPAGAYAASVELRHRSGAMARAARRFELRD